MKSTKEKIVEASMELFSTKGYEATTTKEISKKAGISEMTLFRCFKNKLSLKNYILENMFTPPNLDMFKKEIKYDLYHDLHFISNSFADFAYEHKNLIQMKAQGNMMGQRHVKYMRKRIEPLVECVKDYFDEMHKKGVINSLSKTISRTYIISVLGIIAAIIFEDGSKEMLTEEIKNYTDIFIRGIKE